MNPLTGITAYLASLEKKLRLLAWTRGAAIFGGAALIATVLLVMIVRQYAFSGPSVFGARVALFLVVAAAISAGLVWPLLRLNRFRAARRAEQEFPQFQERLLTFTERSDANAGDPFLPLLAADALKVADTADSEQVAPKSHILSFASAGAASVAVLLWLGVAGPGYLGYGTSLLWGGYTSDARKPIYSISVAPGNSTIRRRTDLRVTARLFGFESPRVSMMARYASSSKWEQAPMQPRSEAAGYEFYFVGVPEPVEYYIEAGGVKSQTYKINVSDLPGVKHVKVHYHFPAWSGLPETTEDPGGDLRAVEGTVADVEITTDKPLANGSLVIDDKDKIALKSTGGNTLVAQVPINKDGMYHIAAADNGELVRLSDDYFIEARKDNPPTVSITRPGKDAKANPIEEVTIGVSGRDDFGVMAMDLHYSVNGGDEKVVPLLKRKGAKSAEESTVLSLEDFKLVPGDLVSFYATAKDARTTSKTDIYFIQAEPFERNYSQSQQGGGGGGGGGDMNDQNQISERQKEIIAATWNQLKATSKSSASENAKYLSEVQGKLKEQAQSLADRMKARELAGTNAAFQSFVKDMEQAAASMQPASDQLKGQKWNDALAPEQKALQYLLRAEATFRDIQVSFGQRGGGGGGGAQGASRDLESLFDLELDKDKNQYEASQQSASEQRNKAIDDAMRKLEELARRQQALADQARNQPTPQQRWQQEMLRREAEQLRQQMEQLQRDQQSGQQSQSQQGQQGSQSASSSSGGQSGQSGQQSRMQQQSLSRGQQGQQQQQQQQQGRMDNMSRSQSQQLEQALNRLAEAERQMAQATSAMQNGREQQSGAQQGQQNGAQQRGGQQSQQGQQGQMGQQNGASQAQAQADARKAAEGLQQAKSALSQMRQQENGDAMGNIVKEANRLAQEQQSFDNRMRQHFGSGAPDPLSQQGMYGGYRRRRMESADDLPDMGSADQSAKQMADEKDKMAGDVQRLEQQIQSEVRDLMGTNSDAANKLRQALGAAEQDELGNKMKTIAEYLRKGLGPYAVMREAPVTQSLNNLRDQVQQIQGQMGQNDNGKGPGNDKQLEAALQQIERLRQEIENLRQGGQQGQQGQQGGQQNGQRGQGQQPGQQQGQKAGQQNGQQGGQQSGQQAGSQQGGQQGGQQSGGNQAGGQQGGQQAGGHYGNQLGTRNGSWGYGGAFWDPTIARQNYSDAVRDMGRVEGAVRDNPDMLRQLRDVGRMLPQFDPNRYQNGAPRDLDKLFMQAVTNLEGVEAELRRKAEQQQGGSIRSATPQPAPPGYADAVADYFRRLSKEH